MARRQLQGVLATVMVALHGLALSGGVPPRPAGPEVPGPEGPGPVVVGAPRAGWQWPLEPAPAVVRPFQPSPTPWGAGHRGVDLRARAGQPVLAAGSGWVSFAGRVADRGVLAVTHPGGLRTTYEPVRSTLPAGTVVRAGQQVAVLDPAPGHCAPAACLHWGLLRGVGPAATYLDPLSLLGVDLAPPVLLPLGGS